jgi:hypothetical protein
MPELSSQAQEVFWAFNRAASGKPEEWHYLPAIAAALRAAADHCHSQEIREADHTTRRWICVDDLLAIASELETQ